MAVTDQAFERLIERARDVAVPAPDRRQAFGELVGRFQDLAFGCACARLRDPCLAEDAAQDAFLLAWERLDQLREPAAFPAWMRRLVLTQCHRRLRGRRLELRPENEAHAIAAASDTAADIEARDTAMLVRAALAQLRPNDRLVLILFFGSERTQEEIAAWLRVPVSTVSRRLAHAKRRLRQQTLDALSGGLRAQRRAAGEAFVMEFSTRLRRAQPDDVTGIASLASELGLDRADQAPRVPACSYLVEDPVSRSPIAYAAAAQTIFKPIYELQLAIGDEALERHAGDVLLTQVVQDLVANDAVTIQHRTSSRHAAVVEFLVSRGFQIIERAQDWRLAAGPQTYTEIASGAAWEFRGIDALSQDPALFDAALELLTEAIADTPSAGVVLPIHPDTLHRTLRRQREGVLALAGGVLQGLIASSPDDLVPACVRVNMVVVRKATRHQGLATVLLARLLAAHPEVSARLVTASSAEAEGWLTHCGFVQADHTLVLERLLRKTVAIPPQLLDEYVGQYVVEAKPEHPLAIDIERHGDLLVSKSRDMRDVLLAASESEFFTRHHYGRGRFERDLDGRVVRLVYTEGPLELLAVRQ
jgi:RNA polymerase sigma factor (sigma-70 family)